MLLLTILCHTTLTTLLLYHAALCRAVPCRAADQLAIAIEDNAKASLSEGRRDNGTVKL